MLYKNLPDAELNAVMRMRFVLDYVAAAVFVLKGDMKNAVAVYKARKEYASMRPSFKADREENLCRTVVGDIPERKKYSIVWQSKVKGKKRFVQLP